ncbi:prion-like-(Q/N-rich) domain-bearing protein 25 [Ruditapes philippinarum]|uniref:prion-like-(Q/N-rich) domain-bearing protein 25 n=1 Tax=Ruditapes philippinarum TaxID=129788 RepID=UPI00295C1656|nr:prion-like-(Q/N-rich) domain-bearing protein 25 [Ruditapes philippinarum]XP_060607596.1 prion-like-(Q/N-rich) domain-bearing protein 25 [Ruditapes philippinarum]
MTALYRLVLICIFIERAFTANIDESCANNDACTVSNSKCVKDYSNCDNGKCRCNSGFTSNTAKTSCLTNKELDEACSATTHCLYGAECNSQSNLCKCPSGQTYSSMLKMCVITGLKAITEECSADTECYGYTSSNSKVECVVASGSSSSTKYCTCKAGYITENKMCRVPHATEACTTAVGCTKHVDLGSNQGQEAETCVSSVCTCPSTSDKVSREYSGTTYTLCYTKYTSKKASGITCTQSNQCSSLFCDSCPGETAKKCLVLASSNTAVAVTSSMAVLVFAVGITRYMF